MFRLDTVVGLTLLFNINRLMANPHHSDEFQGITLIFAFTLWEQSHFNYIILTYKRVLAREPAARACTRIKSASGADPRRFKLMELLWRPSFPSRNS